MMNSRTTKHARHAKWQNIVIIFILLFMLISALPNLYSDKVNIHLINNNTQSEQI
jgi:preprotein translocase subunit SecD